MTCIGIRDGTSIGFDGESVAQDSRVGISLDFAIDVTHSSNVRKPQLPKSPSPPPLLVLRLYMRFLQGCLQCPVFNILS